MEIVTILTWELLTDNAAWVDICKEWGELVWILNFLFLAQIVESTVYFLIDDNNA